jgi:hypothetical protein
MLDLLYSIVVVSLLLDNWTKIIASMEKAKSEMRIGLWGHTYFYRCGSMILVILFWFCFKIFIRPILISKKGPSCSPALENRLVS